MTIECPCGNDEPSRFLVYEQSLGVFCKRCKKEWLSNTEINPDSTDEGPGVKRVRVYRPRDTSQYKLHENNVLMVQSSRIRETDISQLKIGDHIAFHRPYIIWHHGIVTRVHTNENAVEVINWQMVNRNMVIIQQKLYISKERGDLYKIKYTSDIDLSNPPRLVIARARSRLWETGFHIFNDNCESFATFCKTGVSKSHQYSWLVAKACEVLGHIYVITVITCLCTLSCVAANVVGIVGPVDVIVLEGLTLIWDIIKAYSERRNGNLSRNEYVKIAIRRIVDGVVTVTFTIVGIIVGVSLVVTGPIVPCLLACAVGGIIGASLGKIGGTLLGSLIGRAIVKCFKTDDKAVDKITDLMPGDHVVLTKWALHPRCHGILVEHDGQSQIRIIRNKCKHGVVDEWVPFEKPLYLVMHKKKKCFPNETVLKRARGQLGARRYNIVTHNCKTFANWCKRRQ
ncbi:uncharacterized protein LOC132557956 [Ylistrum balloti]|uniref:uncharacterized protein LOC132557956 n=1 Tax=Ylistrum balloti TaxID=509963 RepID=UPI002905F282|nr:uncharacterized protein LOC132557956 [Ylistrum balloti]